MRYDPEVPVAVFLGPSLEAETARSILPANYYPPVELGDVYRLLATGIEMVVVIDGVFYASAPVWQRELAAALDFGITVVGASSMGALRAAELAPYGMIGCGTIYDWYREGKIYGDDEVALLHLDAEYGFRKMSEPLVNIRYNLDRACHCGIITPEQGEGIAEYLKGRYFGYRTYELLFDSSPFLQLPQPVQARLRKFLSEESVDLKRADAVKTLEYCARYKKPANSGRKTLAIHRISLFMPLEVFARGAYLPSGELVSMSKLIEIAMRDRQKVAPVMNQVTRRYFLLRWIEERGLEPPDVFAREFFDRWCKRYSFPEENGFGLRANGLTRDEFKYEVYARAKVSWILDKGPAAFGLEFDIQTAYIEALSKRPDSSSLSQMPWRDKLLNEAMENCFLNDWAERAGIECPRDIVGDYLKVWQRDWAIENLDDWLSEQSFSETYFHEVITEQALAGWLVKQGSLYFGDHTWVPEIAFLRELQVTGQVAGLAEAFTRGDVS